MRWPLDLKVWASHSKSQLCSLLWGLPSCYQGGCQPLSSQQPPCKDNQSPRLFWVDQPGTSHCAGETLFSAGPALAPSASLSTEMGAKWVPEEKSRPMAGRWNA